MAGEAPALLSWPFTGAVSADLGVIVLAGKVAPPQPPFDGAPIKGQDHTIQNDDDSAFRHAQGLRNFTRSQCGCNALTPLAEQNAKMLGEQRELLSMSVLLLQSWKERGWHRGLFDHERHVPGE